MPDWTVETLKEYVDALLAQHDSAHAERHSAAEVAVTAAFAAQERAIILHNQHVESLFAEREQRNEQRFNAQEKAVNAALSAATTAVNKAEAAAEKRFESTNEFRGQLADQQRNLMPRAEADARFQALTERAEVEFRALRDKIDEIKARMDRGDGRGSGLQAGWGYLVGGVGLFLTLLVIGSILFTLSR